MEPYFFQNPNTGWPMVLTPKMKVVCGDDYDDVRPTAEDEADARTYTKAVQMCRSVDEAASVLSRCFDADFS